MNTQIIFKVDSKIKAKAMKRAKQEGVPFSSFLKMATEKYAAGELGIGIVNPAEKFNAKTARIIRAALRDVEQGKNLSPAFSSAAEMDKYLGI
ncbi:MAG: hypothetical protein WD605_02880 [Candidatus Paceibacterota bacterium]